MRSEVLDEIRGTGDTTLQGYVDKWLNSEAARIADAYDFPELTTRWYCTLSITAPTPQVWAPYELTAVPRDFLKIMNAHLIDTANAEDQPQYNLEVVPSFEFHRLITKVNPPSSGSPTRVCLRRIEGAAEHGYLPRTGTAGIRVVSSATTGESATINVGATYYANANRTDIRKAQTTASLASATPVAITTDTVYGIISLSVTGDSVGRLTFDNTAGTIVYAVTLPWERTASYMVLGFNNVPNVLQDYYTATLVASGTGIRVCSSDTEAADTLVTVTYYTNAAKTTTLDVYNASALTSTQETLVAGAHYGVKAITISGTAPTGTITVSGNWAVLEVTYVAAAPSLSTLDFHCTAKRSMQYMSQTSDTLQPLPSVVQDICMTRAKVRGLKLKEDSDWKNLELEAQRLERLLIHSYNFQSLEEPRMVMY